MINGLAYCTGRSQQVSLVLCLLLLFVSIESLSAKEKAKEEYEQYLTVIDSSLYPMYNFDLSSYDSLLVDTPNAANRMVLLYASYYRFIKDESDESRKRFNQVLDKRFDYTCFEAENRDLALLSEQLIQLRFARARGDYLSSLVLLNRIGIYFNESLGESSNSLSKLYWGLYNYFFAVACDESFFVRHLLVSWPSPDRNKGIDVLQSLSNHSSRFIATEARYFLMRGLWEKEDRPEEALDIADALIEEYPNNILYRYFKAGILADLQGEAYARTQFAAYLIKAEEQGESKSVIDYYSDKAQELWKGRK